MTGHRTSPAPDQVAYFLQSALQLVGKLYEIHGLDDEQASFDWDARSVVVRFEVLNSQLSVPFPGREVGPLVEHEQALEDIRTSCRIITRTILSRVNMIQTFGSGYPDDVGTFKRFWPREDVEALEERLGTLMSGLEMGAQSLSSFQAGKMVHTRESLDSLDVGDERDEREREAKPAAAPKRTPKGYNVVSLFDQGPAGKTARSYTKDTEFTDQEMIIRDFLLESLKFSSMTDREDSVTVAHGGTFDWIFSAENTAEHGKSGVEESLTRWLSNVHDSGIYWISGKPGSGKSTLVHFLRHHSKTTDLLQSWAGDEPLITAGFYFWISGTLEQRSQTGLMRHLLFQLLDQEKYLVPIVFPAKWKHYLSLSTRERIRASVSWGLAELKDALRHFMRHTVGQAKVCLFIDGLDEFAGDHTGIVSFLEAMASSFPHVKFCLSSRPLPVFRAAFGNNPGLELHDLTRQDMLRYAEDHLHGNASIQTLFAGDPTGASSLIEEVVERADGVFLWVTLVVQSLLRRRGYQSISQMQEYLLQHPADIDDLFTYFIFEQSTKDQTFLISRLFQLLQAREEACHATGQDESVTMRLWELALADQLDEANITIPEDVKQANDNTIAQLCSTTKTHFSADCAGLIITNPPSQTTIRTKSSETPSQQLAQSKVSYIHRTVKDYLSLRPIWSRILSLTIGTPFDAHLSLLISHILQLKHPLDPFHPHRQTDEWWPLIPLAFTHARLSPDPRAQLLFIPALDQALTQHWSFRDDPETDHWARSLFSNYEKRKKAVFERPFLSLAAKFGLRTLVHHKLQDHDTLTPAPTPSTENQPAPIPLLTHPLTFLSHRRKTVYPLCDPLLIASLLAHPHSFDPNQVYTDLDKRTYTPWLLVLENLREAERRRWIRYYDTDADGTARMARIVELFLQAGADPNAVLVKSQFDPEATALEVITSLYRKFGGQKWGALRELLVERGAVGVRE
ncbi:hypothetical protein BO70DRAFT_432026 [Aspergillus heteromorphus CBS 117.55]|uniref:NACHT domain-containing protein n=1 Tax=Aspergillus heteromorphus CBS 117.55 TaxID=1448321 RepID=A0A317V9R4_9EURO|nr:uncharacterized protein BO70DRAFT_432026 [Aspergillus heteromorphus CBS 117.55]PWY70936.1 hypothetical protein BO70DRAFT_432026 [Aspergillus heteromorphus CBS 117.55]